jgi:hypothetical protein
MKHTQFKIIEKDVVGEILKLTPMVIEDRKVAIRDPKSGSEAEMAFLPKKMHFGSRNMSATMSLSR